MNTIKFKFSDNKRKTTTLEVNDHKLQIIECFGKPGVEITVLFNKHNLDSIVLRKCTFNRNCTIRSSINNCTVDENEIGVFQTQDSKIFDVDNVHITSMSKNSIMLVDKSSVKFKGKGSIRIDSTVHGIFARVSTIDITSFSILSILSAKVGIDCSQSNLTIKCSLMFINAGEISTKTFGKYGIKCVKSNLELDTKSKFEINCKGQTSCISTTYGKSMIKSNRKLRFWLKNEGIVLIGENDINFCKNSSRILADEGSYIDFDGSVPQNQNSFLNKETQKLDGIVTEVKQISGKLLIASYGKSIEPVLRGNSVEEVISNYLQDIDFPPPHPTDSQDVISIREELINAVRMKAEPMFKEPRCFVI